MRFRFDDASIQNQKYPLVSHGSAIHLSATVKELNPVMDPLMDAKRLRVDVDVPWAGRALLDFDVSGAREAARKIDCK